ncbi:hypothetical protein D3C85_1194830 [compost metagenome]
MGALAGILSSGRITLSLELIPPTPSITGAPAAAKPPPTTTAAARAGLFLAAPNVKSKTPPPIPRPFFPLPISPNIPSLLAELTAFIATAIPVIAAPTASKLFSVPDKELIQSIKSLV